MEVTKAKNGTDDYMIDWCDYVIGDLVREKTHLFKAYNYFNGVRDHYQYQHLEENYGIGNPTSVSFTPLTRKHIEALVGEYLTTKQQPKISCKDKATLTNIHRDKQLAVVQKQKEFVSKYLENAIYKAIVSNGQQQDQNQKVIDETIDRELQEIVDGVNRNFISDYEIAAQNLVQHILQNRDIDFKNKEEQLLLDLLIAGEAYYKVVPTQSRDNFDIEICDPLNTWIDKDPKARYMKSGYKSVVRKWMSPEEIEIKYGNYMKQSDLQELRNHKNYDENDTNFLLVSGVSARCGDNSYRNPGIWNDIGVHPLNNDYDRQWNLIPVYEVEWIDSVKRDGQWMGYCYHAIRIGGDIYILDYDDILMPRRLDSPGTPRLSLNGMWYTNGHGSPYSLMLATADLQDNYDMLNYKLDNLIALSGTTGAIVDLASLPEVLGDDLEERLIKFQGYRKVGLSLVDTSQEGQQSINTIYNGYNDTQGLQAIQYIQLALQQIEDTVSSITGVFRERLGGIEQRDAVANVEVGMQQSYIITKRYYNAMDSMVKEMISDCLDMAKIVYKKGFTGQLVLGDKKEIFTILPEHYSFTSYDIQLGDSADIIKEQEQIKQLAIQLAGGNQVDPEVLLIVSTSKSLTDMYERTLKSIKDKKAENNQLQQLSQQLEEAQKNMQQMQKQLDQSTKKIAQLNERKMALDQQEMQMRQNLEYLKLKENVKLKDKELDLIAQRNKLEAAQMYDDNPFNDAVNNNKY